MIRYEFPPTGGTLWDDLEQDRPWFDECAEADRLQDEQAAAARRAAVRVQLVDDLAAYRRRAGGTPREGRDPMTTSHVLWCVWPVTLDREYTRDELVDQAVDELPRIADDAGARITGPATFRVIDEPNDIEGWETWPGWLLIATMPAAPLARQQSAAA